jgi:hypothetical protein
VAQSADQRVDPRRILTSPALAHVGGPCHRGGMTRQVWTLDDVRAWFAGRVPDGWFVDLRLVADREEILVVGELEPPLCEPHDDTTHRLLCTERIQQFRDDTRDDRMSIADEAELLWGRKVSWGVSCGGLEDLFTTQSVPVMTRLRMGERAVLDTLIDAGVARTRSEALAWCVRLVGRHENDWLVELRSAVMRVEQVRDDGPAGD